MFTPAAPRTMLLLSPSIGVLYHGGADFIDGVVLVLRAGVKHLFAIALLASAPLALADYSAVSKHGADLSGTWALNSSLSEDPEKMLAERLEKERRRYAQRRQEEERVDPPGAQRLPDDQGSADVQSTIEANRPRPQRPWQKRRDENFRQMLNITKTLQIRQSAAELEIVSELDSRRVVAGSHTQVSMPEGQLADSETGWDGEWFVIERNARKGPRVIEKLRILRKTGQLEYMMAWSGDTELSGIKARRIFDRVTAAPPAPDPSSGPVR